MANKKVKKEALKLKKSKVKEITTELKDTDYNDRCGRIAFTFASDNKCQMYNWQKEELKLLIESFKKFESLKWYDIIKDPGFNWERNSHIAIKLPSELPMDVKLHSIRVSGKLRLYGYRAQEYFYIVWFDRQHEVCPMNKPKKFSA